MESAYLNTTTVGAIGFFFVAHNNQIQTALPSVISGVIPAAYLFFSLCVWVISGLGLFYYQQQIGSHAQS